MGLCCCVGMDVCVPESVHVCRCMSVFLQVLLLHVCVHVFLHMSADVCVHVCVSTGVCVSMYVGVCQVMFLLVYMLVGMCGRCVCRCVSVHVWIARGCVCRYVCICVCVYLCAWDVLVCGSVLWPSRRKLELYFLSALNTVALSLFSEELFGLVLNAKEPLPLGDPGQGSS